MNELKFNPRCHSVVFSLYNNLLKDLKILEIIGIESVSPLAGLYEGGLEHSYQVLKKEIPKWDKFIAVLDGAEQECILHVSEDAEVKVGMIDYNYSVDNFTKSIGFLTNNMLEQGADNNSMCLLTATVWGVK